MEIARHAFRHFGHFTAEALLASLRRHGGSASRATVYRAIDVLVEVGLLRRYDIAGGPLLYEPAFGRQHHEHLLCEGCGAMLEFVQEEIERLQDEICRAYRFRATSHTLQIRGLCERCHGAGAAAGRSAPRGVAGRSRP
jgi:Fur family ferric uptake transcriptional regulator